MRSPRTGTHGRLRCSAALTLARPAARRVPGFRKASAAPPQLLINTVGIDKFRNSVAEHLLQATLEEALAPVEKNGFQGAPLLRLALPLRVC